MAYVAISSQLKQDVASKISKLKDKETNTIKRPAPLMFQTLPQDAMQLLWGDKLHLQSQMPVEWQRKMDAVTFTYRFDHGSQRRLSANARIDTSVAFYAPPNTNGYITIDSIKGNPYILPFYEYEMQVGDITGRWNKIRDEVNAFLTKCKSLNEALKLWPDLSHYIPKEYIDRVSKKSEKAQAKESEAMEFLKNMDTDGALAALVMSRMAEAGVSQ